MEVVVVGAGQAGTHIAEALSNEGHDVTMIDIDRERLERASERLDVRILCEHGASPPILERAGAAHADLVAAVTANDEVNLIAAVTARQLGARLTAARVYNQAYHGGGKIEYRNLLGIDLIISPQSLAAFEIAKMIENPAAVAVESFAQGKVQMRQMAVREGSPGVGHKIRDLFPPEREDGILAVSLARLDSISIPGPDSEIRTGDRVTVIMPAGRADEAREMFGDLEKGADAVVIAGGSTTAMMLAQILEGRGVDVKLIELDRNRCRELSRVLTKTHVIHGDATRRSVLEDERVGGADVFVALCGIDEVNLMSSLQAKELGVHQTIVVMNRVDYSPLVERVGISHAVSPRILTGNRILMLVGGLAITSMAVLQGGKAEVVELRAEAGSAVVGKALGKEVRTPKGSIIGAVVRNDEVIVPRGGDCLQANDTVIAFALSSVVEELGGMFTKQV
jgi:trk system potassium uptake protein TrkA